jgi:putative nucleotidyltransferase with HDIG domain
MTAEQQHKRLVAVIDSDAAHRDKICTALMSYYVVTELGQPAEAIKQMAENVPALIITGERVEPGGSPAFIRNVREQAALKDVPILHVIESDTNTALITEAEAAGADSHLARPYRRSDLIRRISEMLNTSIEKEWEALPELQRDALQKSVGVFHDIADVLTSGEAVAFGAVKDNCQPLVEAIENNDFQSILDGVRNHDDYTYAHSMRVATLLSLLGHAAGFKNDDQLLLASGGLLHDVGKMMIPHNILNKPGKLSEEEFEIMKSHVPETLSYLDTAGDIPKGVMIIAAQHHEKIDGTGYPYGLKGKELNELARMAAIVDVFSALTDRRVYKPPMEADKAMTIMTEEMTNHLDPHFVKLFKGVLVDSGVL